MDRPRAGKEGPVPHGLEAGKRLLAVCIDHCAQKNPNRVWASIPRSERLVDGYKDITYREFADAVDRASWWLESVLGKGVGNFETFAYSGPKDLRYPVLAMAAIKVGKQILLTSPSLTLEAHLHLLDATGCRTYMFADLSTTVVQQLQSNWPRLRQLAIPSVGEWFSRDEPTPYPYDKEYAEAKDDPTIIFHTTGTTGLPKPVVYTNQMITTFDAGHLLPDPEHKLLHHHFASSRVYSPLPHVHVIGMFLALQLTVFWNTVMVMGPVSDEATPVDIVDWVLQFGNVSGALFPASLLEDITPNPPMFERIKLLNFVAFAGAPLSKLTGDLIAPHTNLVPIIGSTEVGLFTNYVLDSINWNYYKFQQMRGFEFEKHSDTLYELVIRKRPGNSVWQQVFYLYPSLNEFHTKDLFCKHPTEHNAWSFAGRTDEVITLTSGRLHGGRMEAEIQRHPKVQAALVGGERRKRPFLLVEMAPFDGENKVRRRQLLEMIWPTVQKANETCTEPFRLSKSLIIIAKPSRPLVRTSSGNVMRRESFLLYKKDIDKLYTEFWDRSAEFERLSVKVSWATKSLKRVMSGSELRGS